MNRNKLIKKALRFGQTPQSTQHVATVAKRPIEAIALEFCGQEVVAKMEAKVEVAEAFKTTKELKSHQ